MSSIYSFKGGIHPNYEKGLVNGKKIEKLSPPKIVIIPFSQNIGAPAKPVVEVGQDVKIGEKIGQAGGFVSVDIHSSISGKVIAIEPRPHPLGKNLDSIIIENDGQDSWAEPMPKLDLETASKEELKTRIQNAGIVGMGGATFPTHVKLSPPANKSIDTVILNGAECEPFLSSDHRLMVEYSEKIIKGFLVIKKILSAKNAYIAIEKNKPDAIKEITREAEKIDKEIKIIELPIKYPQGAEKQLIYTLLNRQVPTGGLPLDVGVVVQNVGTSLAIYDAIYEGKPVIERVTTISGDNIKEPKNLLIRIGTPIQNAIDACGGIKAEEGKIISGGPMMGIAQYTTDIPVIKGTSGILLFSNKYIKTEQEQSCIRCGMCIRGCVMGLSPTMLNQLIKSNRFEEADANDVLDCIECGCCSFSCPSNILLVQRIRLGKAEVMAIRKKAKTAQK